MVATSTAPPQIGRQGRPGPLSVLAQSRVGLAQPAPTPIVEQEAHRCYLPSCAPFLVTSISKHLLCTTSHSCKYHCSHPLLLFLSLVQGNEPGIQCMLSKHRISELIPSRVYVYMRYFETGPYYMTKSGFEAHSVTQAGF